VKKISKLLEVIGIVTVLTFSMAACGNGTTAPTPDPWASAKVKSVSTGEQLASEISSITASGYYIMNITSDIEIASDITVKPGVNLALDGSKSGKAVTASVSVITFTDTTKDAYIFVDGGSLEVRNINLVIGGNDDKLISVKGSLVIKENAVLTGKGDSAVWIEGGSVTMSGGVISSPDKCAIDFSPEAKGSFTMTGGTIKDCAVAVAINASGNTVSISGGTISGTFTGVRFDDGVFHGVTTEKNTVTISGGTISGFIYGVGFAGGSENTVSMTGKVEISGCENGINIAGGGNTVSMTGGTISGCGDGINIAGGGNTVSMTGGTIKGSKYRGVNFYKGSENSTFTMAGGTISGNNDADGVYFDKDSENSTFTMTGGTISGNKNNGILIDGKGTSFEKTGGIIYGKSAAENNKNGSAAIGIMNNDTWVACWGEDATAGIRYSVKLNADRSVESKEPSIGWW